MNEEIKYRFAVDENGRSADIRLFRSRAEVAGRHFYCLGCGESLIPRLGSELAHHFAHKSNTQCSGETYLHKLAKKVFQEEYERCLAAKLPFEIELEQRKICNHYPGISERVCHTKCRTVTHDLVSRFEIIRVETENGNFVPDITLARRDGSHQIFVEFKVTHGCSVEKRGSKNRIIEISVQSEEDLQPIRDHHLSFSDGKIAFHNFKKDIPGDMCGWFSFCQLAKRVFIKLKSGDYKIKYLSKDQELAEDAAGLIEWTKEEFIDRRDIPVDQLSSDMDLESCIADALGDGRSIRYCKFCEHFDYWGSKECSKFDERVEMTRAVECPHWSLKDYEEYMAILADG